MNMNYDLAKAEIATRLHHADHRRSATRAEARHRPARTRRWQRFRSSWRVGAPLTAIAARGASALPNQPTTD